VTPAARRPLLDPEVAAPDPAFADPAVRGSRVPEEALRPDALRRRFGLPPAWQPEVRTDGRLPGRTGAARPAAVLVPLLDRAEGVTVLLTLRAGHLSDHAGQVSFPGGRIDAADADAVGAALRESEEELGLPATRVEVIGRLPLYETATGYAVTPVVGLVRVPAAGLELRPHPGEVDEAFEVPLAFLMDPRNHERRVVEAGGGRERRTFYAMPYEGARRYFIWGATAAMLRNLYHFLRA